MPKPIDTINGLFVCLRVTFTFVNHAQGKTMKGHPFTPKVECDHACQVRRRYKTKNHAKAASTSVFARTGKLRQVEVCRHCNGWHLGDFK